MKTFSPKNIFVILVLACLTLATTSCDKEEDGPLKPVVRIDSVFNGSPGGYSVKAHVENGKGEDNKIIAKGVVYHAFQIPDMNNGIVFQDVSGSQDFVVDIAATTKGWVRVYAILKDGSIMYSEKAEGVRKDYFNYTNFLGKEAMIVLGKANNIDMNGNYMNSSILVGANSMTDGMGNTIKIEVNTLGSAANFCSDLVLDGYSDWYLPAVDEYLYAAQALDFELKGIGSNWHWTSTEVNNNSANAVFIFNGGVNTQPLNKAGFTSFSCMRSNP